MLLEVLKADFNGVLGCDCFSAYLSSEAFSHALEDLTIPLPALTIQQQIIELNQLMVEEKNLMNELAAQREILVNAVCNNMIGKSYERKIL